MKKKRNESFLSLNQSRKKNKQRIEKIQLKLKVNQPLKHRPNQSNNSLQNCLIYQNTHTKKKKCLFSPALCFKNNQA